MSADLTDCAQSQRRLAVRAQSALFGLDYVEVDPSQTALTAVFLGKAPAKLETGNIRIVGGRRVRDIQVTALRLNRQEDPTVDDSMDIELDRAGDFSTYTLRLVKLDERGFATAQPLDGLDPRYGQVDFGFKVSCPSDLDCKSQPDCPPPTRVEPEINYLAKDYTSFRQLLLDRLALTCPDWQESHAPDLGLTLLELLAYVGDYLSYYQDAVASEAYLATARQRISVRRHVRLVDYAMHEGQNARAFVTCHSSADLELDSEHIQFVTAYPGAGDAHTVDAADLARVPGGSYEVFEPLWPRGMLSIYAAHSEIHFYTWGDCQCCLPLGATRASLLDQWAAPAAPQAPPSTSATLTRALQLRIGDLLIFEEVIGPGTGNPADADPTHRQVVRLTSVMPGFDPLYPTTDSPQGQPIVEIEWAAADALRFKLCLSAQAPPPACDCLQNVTLARGNVLLVDHGASGSESLGAVPTQSTSQPCPTPCEPAETRRVPGRFRPSLTETGLTFSQPLPPGACAAIDLLAQDPRRALPQISLLSTPGPADSTADTQSWLPRADLLQSGADEPVFVVEMADDGVAHLRFGEGRLGQRPQAGSTFEANFRVGNGPAGNVGADSISYLVLHGTQLTGIELSPRNPIAASGGVPPEPVSEVKLFAPRAFRQVLERAITADDYAALAADNARRSEERLLARGRAGKPCAPPFVALQGAKAQLRWTGSWYEATVAIDPVGTEDPDPALERGVAGYLAPYRRIGHDLRVAPANYVPIELTLTVCVLPRFQRAHVAAALLDVFSSRALAGGKLGFFHPDNLGFGAGIYASRIIAAAQAVAGVQSVIITRLERLDIGEPSGPFPDIADELPPGSVLRLGPLDIARLDNDPSFPEHGRLSLDVRGGR